MSMIEAIVRRIEWIDEKMPVSTMFNIPLDHPDHGKPTGGKEPILADPPELQNKIRALLRELYIDKLVLLRAKEQEAAIASRDTGKEFVGG